MTSEDILKEFMNSCNEIHAVWYGYCDGIEWSRNPAAPIEEECRLEPHYYRLGYMAGRNTMAILFAAIGIVIGYFVL